MQKVFKLIFDFVAAIVIVIILYIIIGMGTSLLTVNKNQSEEGKELSIFIQSNGVHTDIILPIQNEIMDWQKFVDPSHTKGGALNYNFVAFGWGDLGFYEQTPEWKDLKPEIAVKALFLDSPAAMHVKFKFEVLEDDQTIAVKLTSEQYKTLVEYIKNSFTHDETGQPLNIPSLHYNLNDAFYHAQGSLSLLKTCNTWTNNALKFSGLRASVWTPFVEGIFYSYGRY